VTEQSQNDILNCVHTQKQTESSLDSTIQDENTSNFKEPTKIEYVNVPSVPEYDLDPIKRLKSTIKLEEQTQIEYVNIPSVSEDNLDPITRLKNTSKLPKPCQINNQNFLLTNKIIDTNASFTSSSKYEETSNSRDNNDSQVTDSVGNTVVVKKSQASLGYTELRVFLEELDTVEEVVCYVVDPSLSENEED
jgi:hypothetical protein